MNERRPAYYVVRNLNDATDLRVIRDDQMYPMIYAVVFGPATQAEAESWRDQQIGQGTSDKV
jgi:hypothetical protein